MTGDQDPATVLAPALAAALQERGALDPRQRPMLAAHWLVDGHDGPALRALAGLRGEEREVSDLWPAALAELGVPQPLPAGRALVLPWAAARVLAGERDLRWLLRLAWPDPDRRGDRDGDAEEDVVDVVDVVDRIVYSLDELLDTLEHTRRDTSASPSRRRRKAREQEREALLLQETQLLGEAQQALEAIARGDWDTATAVLAGGAP